MTTPRYDEIQPKMQSGDLILFRPAGGHGFGALFSRLICIGGRNPTSHVGLVIRIKGDPSIRLGEMVIKGGRCDPLRDSVKKYPGQFVWKPTNVDRYPEYDGKGAARYMMILTAMPYGFLSIVKAAMLHLPFVRMLVKPDLSDDTITRYPPFCSQAVSRAALHGGGEDCVEHLSNRLTEPGDCDRSALWSSDREVALRC